MTLEGSRSPGRLGAERKAAIGERLAFARWGWSHRRSSSVKWVIAGWHLSDDEELFAGRFTGP